MMRTFFLLLVSVSLLSCKQQKNLPQEFDFGKTVPGKYFNSFFDLKIAFNPEWSVQNKKEMNDLVDAGTDLIASDNKDLKFAVEASKVNTAYLLAIFKHDPSALMDSNPSFMVVAENTKNFSDIENGKDYLDIAKGLLLDSGFNYSFSDDIYEKKIGESSFYVLETEINYLNQSIFQEYMTTLRKGFCLSFILSYSTVEEKEELYEIINNILI